MRTTPGVEAVRKPSADDLGERDDDRAAGGVLSVERGHCPAVDDLLGLGLQDDETFLESVNLAAQDGDFVGQLQVFGATQGHAGFVHLAIDVADTMTGDLFKFLPDHGRGRDLSL